MDCQNRDEQSGDGDMDAFFAKMKRSHPSHFWSGWPGAYCLGCGCEDARELQLADIEVGDDHPALSPCVNPYRTK